MHDNVNLHKCICSHNKQLAYTTCICTPIEHARSNEHYYAYSHVRIIICCIYMYSLWSTMCLREAVSCKLNSKYYTIHSIYYFILWLRRIICILYTSFTSLYSILWLVLMPIYAYTIAMAILWLWLILTYTCMLIHLYTHIPAPQIPCADLGSGEVGLVEDGKHQCYHDTGMCVYYIHVHILL